MANKIILSKSVFEWLIKHLVFIEENADELADFYYPYLPIEKRNMKNFFKKYIKRIEAELDKIIVVDSADKFSYDDNLNKFPFAIIGSQVYVTDLSDYSIACFKIIHPVEQGNQNNEITYLTTLGKTLLIKEAGSEVGINTPSGSKNYKILTIKLTG